MKNGIVHITLSICLFLIAACSGSDESKNSKTQLNINTDYILLKKEGGTAYLDIASDTKWTIFVDNEEVPIKDLEVTPLSGNGDETIKITYGSEINKYPYEHARLIFYYYSDGERVSKEVLLSRQEKVNENDHINHFIGFVKSGPNHSNCFISSDGYKIIPNQLVWLDGNMYLINGEYKDSMVDKAAKTITVDLITDPLCIDGPEIKFDDISKYPSNVPLYALNYNENRAMFFDKYTLILPIHFWVYSRNAFEEFEEELDRHSFSLIYNSNGNSDNNLDLQLLHNISEDEPRERTSFALQYKAFNIMPALSKFEAEKGIKPNKITIEYKINTSNDRLENARTEKCILNYNY